MKWPSPKRPSLNIIDPCKAKRIEDKQGCYLYMDRYRGGRVREYIFIVYSLNEEPVWHIEPINLIDDPYLLVEKLRSEEILPPITPLLAGGSLTQEMLDFWIFNNTGERTLEETIARAFGSTHPGTDQLHQFANAHVAFNSIYSSLGTIKNILDRFGLNFN